MIEKNLSHFDPVQIMESGQCFRWNKEDENKISLVAFGKYLEIEDKGSGVYSFSCDEKEWCDIWESYFDVDTDYPYVESLIKGYGDTHLCESFEKGSGIRILKQDLWETIVSFMISQNNNIPRIRKSIELICEKAGKVIDKSRFLFPGPFDVSEGFFEDRGLGLGYRSEYLENIYKYVRENPNWLDELEKMDYNNALGALLTRKGIGTKVANCICLFGLHHIDAFPIDTHVKQLLEKFYPEGFDLDFFKGYAGVVQQYLFYNEIKKDGK